MEPLQLLGQDDQMRYMTFLSPAVAELITIAPVYACLIATDPVRLICQYIYIYTNVIMQ